MPKYAGWQCFSIISVVRIFFLLWGPLADMNFLVTWPIFAHFGIEISPNIITNQMTRQEKVNVLYPVQSVSYDYKSVCPRILAYETANISVYTTLSYFQWKLKFIILAVHQFLRWDQSEMSLVPSVIYVKTEYLATMNDISLPGKLPLHKPSRSWESDSVESAWFTNFSMLLCFSETWFCDSGETATD